jgi:hypothetical protein
MAELGTIRRNTEQSHSLQPHQPPVAPVATGRQQTTGENVDFSRGWLQTEFNSSVHNMNDPAQSSVESQSSLLGTLTPAEIAEIDALCGIAALLQLVDMGFRPEHCRIALKECDGNVSRAITFCLEHGEEEMQWLIQAESNRLARAATEPVPVEPSARFNQDASSANKPKKGIFQRLFTSKGKQSSNTSTVTATHHAAHTQPEHVDHSRPVSLPNPPTHQISSNTQAVAHNTTATIAQQSSHVPPPMNPNFISSSPSAITSSHNAHNSNTYLAQQEENWDDFNLPVPDIMRPPPKPANNAATKMPAAASAQAVARSIATVVAPAPPQPTPSPTSSSQPFNRPVSQGQLHTSNSASPQASTPVTVQPIVTVNVPLAHMNAVPEFDPFQLSQSATLGASDSAPVAQSAPHVADSVHPRLLRAMLDESSTSHYGSLIDIDAVIQEQRNSAAAVAATQSSDHHSTSTAFPELAVQTKSPNNSVSPILSPVDLSSTDGRVPPIKPPRINSVRFEPKDIPRFTSNNEVFGLDIPTFGFEGDGFSFASASKENQVVAQAPAESNSSISENFDAKPFSAFTRVSFTDPFAAVDHSSFHFSEPVENVIVDSSEFPPAVADSIAPEVDLFVPSVEHNHNIGDTNSFFSEDIILNPADESRTIDIDTTNLPPLRDETVTLDMVTSVSEGDITSIEASIPEITKELLPQSSSELVNESSDLSSASNIESVEASGNVDQVASSNSPLLAYAGEEIPQATNFDSAQVVSSDIVVEFPEARIIPAVSVIPPLEPQEEVVSHLENDFETPLVHPDAEVVPILAQSEISREDADVFFHPTVSLFSFDLIGDEEAPFSPSRLPDNCSAAPVTSAVSDFAIVNAAVSTTVMSNAATSATVVDTDFHEFTDSSTVSSASVSAVAEAEPHEGTHEFDSGVVVTEFIPDSDLLHDEVVIASPSAPSAPVAYEYNSFPSVNPNYLSLNASAVSGITMTETSASNASIVPPSLNLIPPASTTSSVSTSTSTASLAVVDRNHPPNLASIEQMLPTINIAAHSVIVPDAVPASSLNDGSTRGGVTGGLNSSAGDPMTATDSHLNIALRRRQIQPHRVELMRTNNKYRAFVTMKQPHLKKTENSPQGNRHDEIVLGDCATEGIARDLCECFAPPIWQTKVYQASNPGAYSCTLCKVSFSMFFKPHHCRNCGFLICGNCSDKFWPGTMLPETFHDEEKWVRVCHSCHYLAENFVVALCAGDYQTVRALYASGNISLHQPYSVYSHQAYPVHYAVLGGNLDILKWLIDIKRCSIVSQVTRAPLMTQSGWTLLGLAAYCGHVDMIRFLVLQKKCQITEIKEVISLQRAMHALLGAPGSMPQFVLPKGQYLPAATLQALQDDLLLMLRHHPVLRQTMPISTASSSSAPSIAQAVVEDSIAQTNSSQTAYAEALFVPPTNNINYNSVNNNNNNNSNTNNYSIPSATAQEASVIVAAANIGAAPVQINTLGIQTQVNVTANSLSKANLTKPLPKTRFFCPQAVFQVEEYLEYHRRSMFYTLPSSLQQQASQQQSFPQQERQFLGLNDPSRDVVALASPIGSTPIHTPGIAAGLLSSVATSNAAIAALQAVHYNGSSAGSTPVVPSGNSGGSNRSATVHGSGVPMHAGYSSSRR